LGRALVGFGPDSVLELLLQRRETLRAQRVGARGSGDASDVRSRAVHALEQVPDVVLEDLVVPSAAESTLLAELVEAHAAVRTGGTGTPFGLLRRDLEELPDVGGGLLDRRRVGEVDRRGTGLAQVALVDFLVGGFPFPARALDLHDLGDVDGR